MPLLIAQLNFNPKVPIDLMVAMLILIALIITIFSPKRKRLFHFNFIQLGLLGLTLFYVFEAMANLFLSESFMLMSGIVLFPCAILFLVGINLIMKEKVNTLILVTICCFGVIYSIIAFFPGSTIISLDGNFMTIRLDGWFKLLSDIFQILIVGMIGYWGIITWFNAPFLVKKEATLFFIGTTFLVFRVIINLLVFFNPLWILAMETTVATGIILFTLSISNQPKLLFILPFTLYRILIRNKNGYLLFDHDWSKSKINEQVFTGFLNAIQLMSKEVINLGGVLDVDLKEGILMLHESQYITVGLLSSKTSRFLRDSLNNFVSEFEEMFKHDLKAMVRDPKRYEATYFLIDKYFANFPMRIIKDKKDAILLEGKFLKLPEALEEKLKKVATSEEEMHIIKSELLKAPQNSISDFFNLYNKLDKEDKDDLENQNF